MKALLYLWFLKTKAQLRFIFRKISSALLTIFVVLLYGGILIFSFLNCDSNAMQMSEQLHTSVLFMIGFLALLVFSTLMSPKKALFMGEDAYFLFCGPFSKKHVLSYLLFQTFQQALMIEIFVIYMFAAMSMGLSYHWLFYTLLLVGVYFILITFLILTDYFYLCSMTNSIYNKIPYGLFGVCALIVGYVYLQSGSLNAFTQSSLFHIIPFFGWLKWMLVSFVQGNIINVFISFGLLLGMTIISILLLVSYKEDFYEQALNDGIELSKMTKEARSGKRTSFEEMKVKNNASGLFKDGAYAILSKNILIMKKTGQWITKSDLITLGMYMAISIFMDIGYGFFIYFLIMYIFSTLQQSSLLQDLQNYRIYLIPDSPMKKLISVILPTFIKVAVISSISLVMMGLYYKIDLKTLVSYAIMLLGYISIFISATVLSLKLLGNRSSQVFENLIRMLLMVVCSVPSIIVIYLRMTKGWMNPWMMFIYANSSVIMNFVISLAILYLCKDMMNGRELKSAD